MHIINKILLKLRIEKRFLLEQKWGIKKPSDPHTISKSILKRYLPKNPIIIDCGAHIGSDSIELAKIFTQGKIHSFEPVPALYKFLKFNSRKQSNIFCYELALSNTNGIAKMFVSSGTSDASSSLLKPTGHLVDHPNVHFDNGIEVKTQTLDTWAEKNNIDKVDFLWLDMQGFELQMLKASNKILHTIKALHTEVSIKETYADAVLYKEFRVWLEGLGFELIAESILKGTDMGNALFVRKK